MAVRLCLASTHQKCAYCVIMKYFEYSLCSCLGFKHEKIMTVCETGMIATLTEFTYQSVS